MVNLAHRPTLTTLPSTGPTVSYPRLGHSLPSSYCCSPRSHSLQSKLALTHHCFPVPAAGPAARSAGAAAAVALEAAEGAAEAPAPSAPESAARMHPSLQPPTPLAAARRLASLAAHTDPVHTRTGLEVDVEEADLVDEQGVVEVGVVQAHKGWVAAAYVAASHVAAGVQGADAGDAGVDEVGAGEVEVGAERTGHTPVRAPEAADLVGGERHIEVVGGVAESQSRGGSCSRSRWGWRMGVVRAAAVGGQVEGSWSASRLSRLAPQERPG